MKQFSVGDDVTLGFIRDQEDQEEFFLVIKSAKTNESLRIMVDDIDEIEHVQGTLKFFIHYQKRVGSGTSLLGGSSGTPQKGQAIKNLFKKKLKVQKGVNEAASSDNPSLQQQTVESSEQFESKYVKNIIESFNTVLEIIEKEEQELDEWMQDEIQASKDSGNQITQSQPKIAPKK